MTANKETGDAKQDLSGCNETEPISLLVTSVSGAAQSNQTSALLTVGQDFGEYHIIRLLGKGGMGAVYEAEHRASGRRVALKALGHRLESIEARKRFLREGRMAASLNHPNSVYVYGADEIRGVPVIAMELLPGGTLADLVRRNGTLPITKAVDYIIQIISGLEAAQTIGILHRDIKPSNCFVTVDGSVKIGDFGLSIPTEDRGELKLTRKGLFMGTPAFASPEQIRGDKLDVRSDICSVGATLFYLLTGKPPFTASNAMQEAIAALQSPASSPAAIRPEIPPGLAEVVLRCLAKQPDERFQTYPELREALRPFCSANPVPAGLLRRVLASCIDLPILSILSLIIMVLWQPSGLIVPGYLSWWFLAFFSLVFALPIQYFGISEGFWGASPGKCIAGIKVVPTGGGAPSLSRAMIRAMLITFLCTIGFWFGPGLKPILPFPFFSVDPNQSWLGYVRYFSIFGMLGLLFITARRRNGFAAIHDWLSGTRVVRRAEYQERVVIPVQDRPHDPSQSMAMVGPYQTIDVLGRAEGKDYMLGFDPRLLRNVWIVLQSPGAPSINVSARNLARPTRLRWLAGRSATNECWDAYGALTGQPFWNMVVDNPQPWHIVRHWLHDLATELNKSGQDGSFPDCLSVDRLWVTGEGRIVLLEFPAPGIKTVKSITIPNSTTPGNSIAFLRLTAYIALSGIVPLKGEIPSEIQHPLPLHAQRFINELSYLSDISVCLRRLDSLIDCVARVTPRRRLALIAGCALIPIAWGLLSFTLCLRQQYYEHKAQDEWGIRFCMERLAEINAGRHKSMGTERENMALAATLAFAFYQKAHGDPVAWESAIRKSGVTPEQTRNLTQIVTVYGSTTTEDLQAMKPTYDKICAESKRYYSQYREIAWRYGSWFNRSHKFKAQPWEIGIVNVAAVLFLVVAVPSIIASLLFRTGLLLWLLGLAIVDDQGRPVSRLRMLLRTIIIWSSVLVLVVIASIRNRDPSYIVIALALGVMLAGALWAWLTPRRSVQDWLAGTYLVSR